VAFGVGGFVVGGKDDLYFGRPVQSCESDQRDDLMVLILDPDLKR
jgi:hypothetical protein